MTAVARVFANRYQTGALLGRGGMSDVYLGRDGVLDRPVAIKVLSGEFAVDPVNVERFRREAQAAAGLSHPNIVSIYDWGQDGDASYIVMEYVRGNTLRELLDTYGRLPVAEAARIAGDIAAALQFAHEHGVVHRDVKPGNVLITSDGAVKVTDFGIARAQSTDALTRTGAVLGTATYFSPEQAQGLPLDGRSDVYALGVVLYEMVTGVTPFTGASPVSIAYKHVREEPTPPSAVAPGVPGGMDRIVLTAMAKDVGWRYQSAADLRADLMRFERGRPLVGGPAPTARLAGSGAPTVAAAAVGTNPRAARPTARPATARQGPRTGAVLAVAGVVALLIALIAVLLSQANVGGGGGSSANSVAVPEAIGVTFGQAQAVLQKDGFLVVRIDRDDPSQSPDQVLAQNPEGGSKLERGGTIRLTVSSATTTMPDVVGQPRDQAQAAMRKANLTPKYVEQDSPQAPGTVLSTDPAAGTKVPKSQAGSPPPTVTVNIAREPTVAVPDLTGQNPFTAAAALQAANLQVTVTQTPNPTIPKGVVIATNPPAGTQVQRGSQVSLLVSTGPDTPDVPNVVGQLKAAAEQALLAAGFNVTETTQAGGAIWRGYVISQTPATGKAARGSTVAIVIGQ